jgi:thioredoxin 1
MSANSSIENSEFTYLLKNSKLPVLVDFWGTGCTPCRVLEKTVDEIAREYRNKIRVVKINVIENLEIGRAYNIRSIPTLLIIKNGKIAGRIIGLQNKTAIVKLIEAL